VAVIGGKRMSKRKKYYFNDGIDGIVIARSLKHAINILRRNGYSSYTTNEIMKSVKKNDIFSGDFTVEAFNGNYKRSRMVGWCE
jgi:hypothetical protein